MKVTQSDNGIALHDSENEVYIANSLIICVIKTFVDITSIILLFITQRSTTDMVLNGVSFCLSFLFIQVCIIFRPFFSCNSLSLFLTYFVSFIVHVTFFQSLNIGNHLEMNKC